MEPPVLWQRKQLMACPPDRCPWKYVSRVALASETEPIPSGTMLESFGLRVLALIQSVPMSL